MRNTTAEALDILTDATLSIDEAVKKFARLTRRWKPASRGFILHIGGVLREYRLTEHRLMQWADDGGPTP